MIANNVIATIVVIVEFIDLTKVCIIDSFTMELLSNIVLLAIDFSFF